MKPSLMKAESLKWFQCVNTRAWNKHAEEVVKLEMSHVPLCDEVSTGGWGIA